MSWVLDPTTGKDFKWWRRALRGVFMPITEDNPQLGCYRLKTKLGGSWWPVRIYRQRNTKTGETKTVAAIWENKRERPLPLDGTDNWICLAKYPITYSDFSLMVEQKPDTNGLIPYQEINMTSADLPI